MSTLIPVEFHGDVLWAQRHDGEVYAAVKPMAEALGLDWKSQYNRIQRDTILSEGMVVMTIPSHGGPQETVCLPLRLMNGWLFGIDENRIKKPEIRARVIAYKKECYEVLHRHFQPKPKPPKSQAEEINLSYLQELVDTQSHLIKTQSQLFDKLHREREAYISTEIVRHLVQYSDLDDQSIAEIAKSEAPYVAYVRETTVDLTRPPV